MHPVSCTNTYHDVTDLANHHCVKSARIRSYSVLYFSVYGLNTEKYLISPYSVRMLENTDQNNSEYGHFLRSAWVG